MAHAQLSLVLRHIRKLAGDGKATDGQLLHRFAIQHEDAAFELLVARHGPAVLRLCRRVLRHEQDAEDVFQATFLALARKASSIRKPESLGCWLYGVASRLAFKVRAKRKTVSLVREPVEPSAGQELCAALDEELSRLAWRYQAPIVLCYLEGKSREEAARQLSWSLGTLKRRLSQGRAMLRDRLTRRGLTLSAVLTAVGLSQETVPAAVVISTARAATTFAAGSAAGVAARLAEGLLKGMLLSKLKIGVTLALAVSLIGVGAGLIIHQVQTEKQPEMPELAAGIAKAGKAESKEQARTDIDGDPLPPGALARMGTLRWRLDHEGAAQWADFSPDGRRLLTVSVFRERSIWDVGTGKKVEHMPADPALLRDPHQVSTWCMAFSADHQILACGERDGTVRVVDPWTGKERHRLVGHGGLVNSVALSPDGRVLLTRSVDQTVRVWDTNRGEQLYQFSVPTEKLQYMSLALSPDAKMFAWIGYPALAIHVAELPTGKERYQLGGHDQTIQRVAFSPDGRLLLSTGNASPVRLWDAATGRPVRTMRDDERFGWVYARFSPNGKSLLASRYVEPVQLWDVASGKAVWRVPAYPQNDGGMVFAPNGKTVIIIRRCESAICLHDAATGKQLGSEGHSGTIDALAFSSDAKRLISLGWDRTLRWWDVATGKGQLQLPVDGDALRFSPDRRMLATARAGIVRISSTDTGNEVLEIASGGTIDTALAFSPNGRLLAWAGSIANTGSCVALWDIATGKEVWRNLPQSPSVSDIAFTPEGRFLVGCVHGPGRSDDPVYRFWNVETGQPQRSLNSPPGYFGRVQLSPDGRTLVLHQEKGPALGLFEIATGQQRSLIEPPDHCGAVCFSPNGHVLITGGSDGCIRFWDAHSGQALSAFAAHRGRVTAVSLSSDGRKLATGGWDTTALIWDLPALLPARPRVHSPSATELQSAWEALAGVDAIKAYQAIGELASALDQTARFLCERLRPIAEPDMQTVARLLANLDSDRFAVREKATADLEGLGELAEPALRRMLRSQPRPEVRRRLERLLQVLEGAVASGERRQAIRAVEVLEQIGTPEAKQLLHSLASGAPEARLTQEAKASLERLAKRS